MCGPFIGTNGFCEIRNCFSTGDISLAGGGITGYGAGFKGKCTVTNCYSTGSIGDRSGGICGHNVGSDFGYTTVTNCYSTGSIYPSGAGGICGKNSGKNNGHCKTTNCYSTGTILGSTSGGVCGRDAGINGESIITNCFSTIIDPQYTGGSNTITVNSSQPVDGFALISTDMLMDASYDLVNGSNTGISPFVSVNASLYPVLRGDIYTNITGATFTTVDISDSDNGGVLTNTILNMIQTDVSFDSQIENTSVAGYTSYDASSGFFMDMNNTLYPFADLTRVTNTLFVLFGTFGSDSAPDSSGEYIEVQVENMPEEVTDDLVEDISEVLIFNSSTSATEPTVVNVTDIADETAIYVSIEKEGDTFTFIDGDLSVNITNTGSGFQLNGTTYQVGDLVELAGKFYKFGSFYGPVEGPQTTQAAFVSRGITLGGLFTYSRSYDVMTVQTRFDGYSGLYLKNKLKRG
jgi:hypothetical protein